MESKESIQEWELAEYGMSGWACPDCGYTLTEAEANSVCRTLFDCPSETCEETFQPYKMTTFLREDNICFFKDENVLGATWFHATTKENWVEELLSDTNLPLVHIGSFGAALTRGRDMCFSDTSDNTWFLYEVTLTSSLVFAEVLPDMEDYAPSKVAHLTHAATYNNENSVIRYVNRYEEPGSVSLIVDARNILVQKKTEIDSKTLDDMFNDLLVGRASLVEA